MKYVLRDNMPILTSRLKTEFGQVSEAFEALLIPFTLRAVDKTGELIKLQEAEQNEILNNYEDLKVHINQLIKTATTFVRKIYTNPTSLVDNGFIRFINRGVTSVLSLYNDVWRTIKEEDAALFAKIENAYFACLMLARVLNTAIRYYNRSHPGNQLSQIEGLPDPQYFDIGENISDFLAEFIRTINRYID
jgi:hypothetical protein